MAKQFDYESILANFRQLHEQANQANESRYQDILRNEALTQETVGGTYGQMEGLLENLGQAESERIGITDVQEKARAEQDLISRGLGNTTIRESVRRGIGEDTARSQRALTEQVGRQKAGVLQGRAGAEERMGSSLSRFMEARTDQGPDMGQLSALLSQAGAGVGTQEASEQTIFTGLSANARAGRDAFGQEGGGGGLQRANRAGINRSVASGSPGDPRFGLRGGGGGGGGGTGATVIGAAAGRFGGGGGGGTATTYRQAAGGQLAGGAGGGGGGAQGARTVGPNPANAGVRGSSFDNLFTGQDVISQGDVIGSYGGGGQVNLQEDLNLVGGGGTIDPNRIPESQGGTAQTTQIPFHRMQEIRLGSGPPMTPEEKRILGYPG